MWQKKKAAWTLIFTGKRGRGPSLEVSYVLFLPTVTYSSLSWTADSNRDPEQEPGVSWHVIIFANRVTGVTPW
jgi:hypothetical protein